MILLNMLEDSDIMHSEDWCRPLRITSMSGGHSDYYSFKSMYSGCPENNVEWVQAKVVIGEKWFGSTVKEYNKMCKKYGCPMEFIRGDIPKSHQLNMKGYSSMAIKPKHVVEDDVDDDIPF